MTILENQNQQADWIDQAYQKQLSADRDFPGDRPVRFKYAICCGHRTGSNLLSETLYQTGQAGDPLEYFSAMFIKAYLKDRGAEGLNTERYLQEFQTRRTSANGVFGINIKFDQMHNCFKDNWSKAVQLIKAQDYVLFLYRKDRLRQAVSLYIANARRLYNVPADVKKADIANLTQSIPFNPEIITACLNSVVDVERRWLHFFKNNDIQYEPLAYEEFIEGYDDTINHILDVFEVPADQRRVPEMPFKKVANDKNEELRVRFLDYLNGDFEVEDSI